MSVVKSISDLESWSGKLPLRVTLCFLLPLLGGCGDSESCCLATCRAAEEEIVRVLRANGDEIPDDVCGADAIQNADDGAACDAAFLSEFELDIAPDSTADACS
ncbi:MAG: hypothetical protein AAFU77_09025 [Myxococcota bacterium]